MDDAAQGERQRREEELCRLLAEHVEDYAVFGLDSSGRIQIWSQGAERVLGYGEEEILGEPFARLFTPEDTARGEPQREMTKAAHTGRCEEDRWHIRKDGSRFWCSSVTMPSRDPAGELRGYAKIMHDITEREAIRSELAQANRRKDEFLAMLSHELRNPLAPIMHSVHLLQQNPGLDDAAAASVKVLDRQVRQLARLVGDLLDVSRMTSGRIPLRRTRIALQEVIDRAVETMQPLVRIRGHQLSVNVPAEPIWMDADPVRLEQVLVNILDNAAKYTANGGRIWLSATLGSAGLATLRIKDNGAGISSELLPRVFDLFVQADKSSARTGGLGVGLALVRYLVELHHGGVEARSGGLGRGSEFTLKLPVASGSIPSPVDSTRQSPTVGGPLRLLVVDGNADAAEALAVLLREHGYEARTAHSGEAALERLATYEPAAVLMDIDLPGMDGYEVARRMRTRAGPDRPLLIAVTGYEHDDDRRRAKEAGFDHLVVEPVAPYKLLELLNAV